MRISRPNTSGAPKGCRQSRRPRLPCPYRTAARRKKKRKRKSSSRSIPGASAVRLYPRIRRPKQDVAPACTRCNPASAVRAEIFRLGAVGPAMKRWKLGLAPVDVVRQQASQKLVGGIGTEEGVDEVA